MNEQGTELTAQWRHEENSLPLTLRKEEALKAIDQRDADRRKLVNRFFNRDIDDPLIYDAVWNTGKVDIQTICDSIVETINARAKARRKRVTS